MEIQSCIQETIERTQKERSFHLPLMVNDYRKFWHDKPTAPVLYANGDSKKADAFGAQYGKVMADAEASDGDAGSGMMSMFGRRGGQQQDPPAIPPMPKAHMKMPMDYGVR